MKVHKPLRCYMVFAAKSGSKQIQDLVSDTDSEIQYFENLSVSPNISIVAKVKKSIISSDFVLAVLDLDNLSRNILFEIGIAYGLGKPIFLLVNGDGSMPLELADFMYIRGKADYEAIKFSLERFLEKNGLKINPQQSRSQLTNVMHNARMRKMPLRSNLHVEEIKVIPNYTSIETVQEKNWLSPSFLDKSNITEAEIMPFLYSLFQREGAIVSEYLGHKDTGADMALWIDSLTNSLGNPLLVEVKVGHLSELQLSEAEKQLRHYLLSTGLQTGLVLYLDVEKKLFDCSKNDSPLILRVDLRQLIERLKNQSITDILLSERNVTVHSRGY